MWIPVKRRLLANRWAHFIDVDTETVAVVTIAFSKLVRPVRGRFSFPLRHRWFRLGSARQNRTFMLLRRRNDWVVSSSFYVHIKASKAA